MNNIVNNAFRCIASGLMLIAVSACTVGMGSAPQNADEFRAAVEEGMSRFEKTTYIVQEDFSAVYNTLEADVTRCLNARKEISVRDRYGSSSEYTQYTANIEKTSGSTGIITVQHDEREGSGPKMPTDGYYELLVDIQAESDGRTRLVFYAPTRGYDDIIHTVVHWAKDENDACPGIGRDDAITIYNDGSTP